jgi:hypothetical protein
MGVLSEWQSFPLAPFYNKTGNNTFQPTSISCHMRHPDTRSFRTYRWHSWDTECDIQYRGKYETRLENKSLLVVLPLLNIHEVRLYSDTENATVINVEGVLNRSRGEVVDKGQEHSWRCGATHRQHIKDSLRQDFFIVYEGDWTTQCMAKGVSSV